MQDILILKRHRYQLAKCQVIVLRLEKNEALSDFFLLAIIVGQRV